ncbi:hypothetical protein LEP1GSC041_3481 [Leptospira noguchii str. 2006001870]|nr:hypothetical protein LEP1GSC041_3481 [Leptospira noguchii str. 2006001870]
MDIENYFRLRITDFRNIKYANILLKFAISGKVIIVFGIGEFTFWNEFNFIK